MASILRYEPWENGGLYFVKDCTTFKNNRAKWWMGAYAINLSPVAFVELLINRFKPDFIRYNIETDTLVYAWRTLAQARNFKNWFNAEARKYNRKV
jgi:hypothetical protein